ncbi:MAG: dihydrodipicolinate synthase family protein [Pirellula sp.]|nr:dihydrodipicolinate synthase family protein [Pirellula sp.]
MATIPSVITHRSIVGISAVLLPFHADGEIDFDSYSNGLERTWTCGLTPAVNMDTGFANLLSRAQRHQVLSFVQAQAAGRPFVAGTFVQDLPGDLLANYLEESGRIEAAGGVPILFQSTGLSQLDAPKRMAIYEKVCSERKEVIGFELGKMFVPFGEIYDLGFFTEWIQIPTLTGIKHSSLSRDLEWQRLDIRNRVRPDFKIYTGNDLAIDMVQWGSDYLLGLSAFYPEAFALRDRFWLEGDRRFYEINDWLQYLGFLAFRNPVPAYKHNCAMFLQMRGVIASDTQPKGAALRPDSDRDLLRGILQRLDELVS